MLRLRWLALSAVVLACGGTPPTPTTPATTTAPTPATTAREPSARQEHTCDDFAEARVITRVDGDALLFERAITVDHCTTPRTQTKTLGRLSLKSKSAACPIGQLAYRFWSGGDETELAALDRDLTRDARAELRQAMQQAATRGVVTAYVLACPSPKTVDLVVVRVFGGEVELRFWAADQLLPTDPRFVRSEP